MLKTPCAEVKTSCFFPGIDPPVDKRPWPIAIFVSFSVPACLMGIKSLGDGGITGEGGVTKCQKVFNHTSLSIFNCL